MDARLWETDDNAIVDSIPSSTDHDVERTINNNPDNNNNNNNNHQEEKKVFEIDSKAKPRWESDQEKHMGMWTKIMHTREIDSLGKPRYDEKDTEIRQQFIQIKKQLISYSHYPIFDPAKERSIVFDSYKANERVAVNTMNRTNY